MWATKPSRLFNLSSSLFHVCLALLLSSCSYCLRTFPKQPLVSRTPSHLPTCPSICAHVGDVWQRCVIVGIATRYRPTFNLQGALLSTDWSQPAYSLPAPKSSTHARSRTRQLASGSPVRMHPQLVCRARYAASKDLSSARNPGRSETAALPTSPPT